MKRRKSWLLAASALASSSLGISEPALAQNECGVLVGGVATCTSTGNPFNSGITYAQTVAGDLTVNLQQGVNVNLISNPSAASPGTAVSVTNNISGNAIVQDLGATITSTAVHPPGAGNAGIVALALNGSAIVTASGIITLGNTDGEDAIVAAAGGGTASVTYTGPNSGPGLIASGIESSGIQAFNFGNGNAIIEASGNIQVSGPSVYGLIAHAANDGNATVTYHSGTINVGGGFARGILAWVDGNGSATATTDAGTFINVSGSSPGVYVFSSTATEANGQKLIADVASTITGVGTRAVGIKAFSGVDAPIFVTYTGPGITTAGADAHGIAGLSGSGSVNVTSTGPITTNGSGAFGILADSGSIAARTTIILPPGGEPIVVTPSVGGAPGGSVVVTTSGPGAITTQGVESHGIWATSTTGTVQVTTTNVSTTGEFSAGINASGGGGTTVTVAGSVMGGWQPDVASVGPTLGLQAAGVILNSSGGTATLTNNGSIGALSDRAVAGDPTIINNGAITGFVQFAGVNDVFNNGVFNLRHFADTNGDGIRDTLRVAVSDLGGGPSTFTNSGTLALLGGPGATTLDSTGLYLPLGLAFNAMALGGPVQGQILGATTFTNSGTIDLQANPVAGDVLLISGGHTPGVNGGGTFISNGGRLLIDTVLNEGGAASRSDVLVVDGTSVGPGGATRLFSKNAGGAGALTVDNGILVVEALDKARSAAGVFALGAPAVAGPYEYTLFHGGVGADAANGNWYLRSTLNCTLAPTLPECRMPAPPDSNFRTETSLYAAIPSMALLYGRNLLDTLHERVGEELDEGVAPAAAPGGYYKAAPLSPASHYAGWGRIIGMNGVHQGDSLGVLGGSAGPHFDYAFLGLQAGMDFYRQDRPDGSRDRAGAYFAIGSNQGQVTHFDGREGNSDFAAYTLGGYWTHFGPTGWYTDAILQGTFYDINSTANRGLPTFKTQGQGFAASLETGYPFKFAGGWFIEPQAQLVFQNININDASDIAAQVRFSDVNSLAGRFGARFGRTWNIDDSPRTITAWIRPNLWNEFQGNPTTSFSSAAGFVPFHADLGGLWGEINAGVSAQVASTTTLFANASYQSRFDGGGFAYTGKAGLRVFW